MRLSLETVLMKCAMGINDKKYNTLCTIFRTYLKIILNKNIEKHLSENKCIICGKKLRTRKALVSHIMASNKCKYEIRKLIDQFYNYYRETIRKGENQRIHKLSSGKYYSTYTQKLYDNLEELIKDTLNIYNKKYTGGTT